jgi:prolipoprotein diacylglyceryltransferase
VLQIGSLTVPFGFIVLVVATLLAWYAGKRVAAYTGLPVMGYLGKSLLVGLVMARLMHLIQHGADYGADPAQVFNVFDGGWKVTAGVGFAWLYGLYATRQQLQMRKPLLFSVVVFSIVWLLGVAVSILLVN